MKTLNHQHFLNFQYFPHMNYIVLQLERNNQLYFAHYHISFSSKEPVHTESVAVWFWHDFHLKCLLLFWFISKMPSFHHDLIFHFKTLSITCWKCYDRHLGSGCSNLPLTLLSHARHSTDNDNGCNQQWIWYLKSNSLESRKVKIIFVSFPLIVLKVKTGKFTLK